MLLNLVIFKKIFLVFLRVNVINGCLLFERFLVWWWFLIFWGFLLCILCWWFFLEFWGCCVFVGCSYGNVECWCIWCLVLGIELRYIVVLIERSLFCLDFVIKEIVCRFIEDWVNNGFMDSFGCY